MRLLCIDCARGMAILFMIMVHFLFPVAKYFPELEAYVIGLLFIGRCATPGFVAVFGITIGYVYLPRWTNGRKCKIVTKLFLRSVVLMISTLILSFTDIYALIDNGNLSITNLLWSSYSILGFYTLAVLIIPGYLIILKKLKSIGIVFCGISLWITAFVLYKYLWLPSEYLSSVGFLRLYFISGGYGFIQLLGAAFLFMPVGIYLANAKNGNMLESALKILSFISILIIVVSILLAIYKSEFSLIKISYGKLKAPPRFWYFMMYGWSAVFIMAIIGLLEIKYSCLKVFIYYLALTGQAPLRIYVAHAFVIPLSNSLETMLKFPEYVSQFTALLTFMMYCIVVLYFVDRKNKKSTKVNE